MGRVVRVRDLFLGLMLISTITHPIRADWDLVFRSNHGGSTVGGTVKTPGEFSVPKEMEGNLLRMLGSERLGAFQTLIRALYHAENGGKDDTIKDDTIEKDARRIAGKLHSLLGGTSKERLSPSW